MAEARLGWTAERPLRWDDFQGSPPAGFVGAEGAKVWLVLECSVSWETFWDRTSGTWAAQITGFQVSAYMDRRKSWVISDRKTPELLLHEQIHFGLLEVHRQILESELMRLAGLRVFRASPKEAEERVRRLVEGIAERVINPRRTEPRPPAGVAG